MLTARPRVSPFLPALALAAACASSPAIAQTTPVVTLVKPAEEAGPAWRQGRSAKLLALLDEHVQWLLKNDPLGASRRGDDRFNDKLPDASPEAVAQRTRDAADRLTRLRALEHAGFTEADSLDADLLALELESVIQGAKFHGEQTPVSQMSGPHVSLPQMADSIPFRKPADYEAFATRLEAVPTLIDQHIVQMRAGMKAGRVPPRITVNGTWDQCFLIASADAMETPSLSPFYKPFLPKGAADPSSVRAREAIKSGVLPAFKRLGEFLRDEYAPACRETVGASEGIDGRASYDFALREHTTTPLTADEIHRIGLAEVTRIGGEMMQAIGRTDYPRRDELKGEALFAAFIAYLRTDPRFYHKTPEELLTGYRDICKRMDAELPRLFGKLPRLPYGVRETPAFAAPTSPTAYYYPGSMEGGVPGFFLANTYRLDQRPKYEMTALALHESVPGHHLQIALAQELEGQHPFHEFLGTTAFVEGWGLYSERLGLEASTNMYADPYDNFGRLTYEMWRACRLVVDTGIHAMGWSRERAISFMMENTALSRHNIEREVDRYIAWPGQATAYKIGQLKISELRARAEKELGPKFDVRAFHDELLSEGAIPLPALEAMMDRWIAASKQVSPEAR